MTHSQRLVVVIKHNGKVLREDGNGVMLPFGAEYSVLVKNLDSKRIQIAVSIDGQDAAGRLIINPNSELELERFIRNGNLQSGNRFKFIERTAAVEQHRGVGAEDGLVRVESWTEVQPMQYQHWYFQPQPMVPHRRWDDGVLRSNSLRSSGIGGASSSLGTTFTNPTTYTSASSNFIGNVQEASCTLDSAFTATSTDAGITVPGSESNQRFVTVSDFPCETQSTVVVLRLRGVVGNHVVQQPLTVEVKPKCVTCGRQNRGSSKFCSQCGTALVIL